MKEIQSLLKDLDFRFSEKVSDYNAPLPIPRRQGRFFRREKWTKEGLGV